MDLGCLPSSLLQPRIFRPSLTYFQRSGRCYQPPKVHNLRIQGVENATGLSLIWRTLKEQTCSRFGEAAAGEKGIPVHAWLSRSLEFDVEDILYHYH